MSMSMSRSTEARERIEDVASRIVALRDAYYRGDPLVADADYDALEGELRALIAAHPDLAPDPNPLDTVGAPAGEGEHARAARGVLRPLPGAAGRRDAQARRPLARARLRRRAPAARGDPR
jgi:hypothetical protein